MFCFIMEILEMISVVNILHFIIIINKRYYIKTFFLIENDYISQQYRPRVIVSREFFTPCSQKIYISVININSITLGTR